VALKLNEVGAVAGDISFLMVLELAISEAPPGDVVVVTPARASLIYSLLAGVVEKVRTDEVVVPTCVQDPHVTPLLLENDK